MINSKSDISKISIKNIDDFLDTIIPQTKMSVNEKADFKEQNKSNLIASVQELISEGHKEREALKIAIYRFGDFNDIEGEKKKFNEKSKVFSKFKSLSILTYLLLIGALRSVFIVKKFIVFYIIIALIGGILLVKKNKAITNKKYKKIVQISDASIIIFLIIFYQYFSILLQIKDIIGLLIITLYMIIYFKLLFDRKLI